MIVTLRHGHPSRDGDRASGIGGGEPTREAVILPSTQLRSLAG